METACQGLTYELLFEQYSTLRICKSEISREEKMSEVYCIVWITGKVLSHKFHWGIRETVIYIRGDDNITGIGKNV